MRRSISRKCDYGLRMSAKHLRWRPQGMLMVTGESGTPPSAIGFVGFQVGVENSFSLNSSNARGKSIRNTPDF